MTGIVPMDYGYCKNARRYDRLTSFRRGMRSRGFSFEEVSDASLEKSIEVYGELTDYFGNPVSDGDRVEYLSPCIDKCPQCMEAHASFRSAKWFARASVAVQAMLDKGLKPAFVTLAFPNLAFPDKPERAEALRDKVFNALWEKHYTAQCKKLQKRVNANPDDFGDNYDLHVHAERLAESYARSNVDGEFQIQYCKPVATFKVGEYMRSRGGVAGTGQFWRDRVNKKSRTYFIDIDALVDGEYREKYGKRCAKDIVELPKYPYCRKLLQLLFARLRAKRGVFPRFQFKYLFFPEVGVTRDKSGKKLTQAEARELKSSEVTEGRIHFHGVFFLSPDSDGDLIQLKEAVKCHWHALTGNIRFPEEKGRGLLPDGTYDNGELWFDPVREARQVASYVAKYASKDTLKGERVLASQGFKWTEAVGDLAVANRALTEYVPTADDWTENVEYQSPFPDRDVLTADKGVREWVGIDMSAESPLFRMLGDFPEVNDAKPMAVCITRDPVLHPAQAVKCVVNGEAYSDVDKGLVRNYYWVSYSVFRQWCMQPRHVHLDLPDGNPLKRLDVAFSKSERDLIASAYNADMPVPVSSVEWERMQSIYEKRMRECTGYEARSEYPKRGILRVVDKMFSDFSEVKV